VFDRIPSPDCPKCGCNDTDMLTAGMRWGKPYVVHQCDHCGHRFGQGSVNVARKVCPDCYSTRVSVVSSPAAANGSKVRYLACQECGKHFKNVTGVR
jgi:predicted  nucleic acid-binding Zn-ribbon protein